MIDVIFITGFVVFAISSLYFFFTRKRSTGINTAFLVSFVTLASYALMWGGAFAVESPAGQPIFWMRWLFYAVSCSMLMLEIAKAKGITDKGKVAELIVLNVFVMVTGTLAAVSMGPTKWVFFILSAIAYIIQIVPILRAKEKSASWINLYIILGWTVFPIVFLLAPTGFGLIGSALAWGSICSSCLYQDRIRLAVKSIS